MSPVATEPVDASVAEEPWAAFRADLLSDGVLLATGVDGIYGRSAAYEAIAEGIDRLVLRTGPTRTPWPCASPP